MVNGTLISFEGPEGAGKSSVLEAILPLLEETLLLQLVNQVVSTLPKRSAKSFWIQTILVWMPRPSCCSILLVAGSIWWNVSCQPLQVGRLS